MLIKKNKLMKPGAQELSMTPLSGPDDPDKFTAPQAVSVFAPFAKIRFVGSRLPDDQNFILFRFVGTRLADDENFI